MTKKEKKAKKQHHLLADFKAFITRGNVLDLAVGVVIGGAFSAIVTSVVNILLSVCMWGVPGGIGGLVTILPALNAAQKAPVGYNDMYTVSDFLAQEFSAVEREMYVQHGPNYYYKGLALIDWGALINAAISFIIIAIVLFAIVKIVAYFDRVKKEAEAKLKEEYYKKHPEARPVVADPEAPAPTEIEVLAEIRDLLKAKK